MGQEVTLASKGTPWRKMFAANVAAASAAFVSGGLQARPFVTPGGSPTNPFASTAAGQLYIDLAGDAAPGGVTPNAIQIKLFGTDAANETLSCRVWGIEEGLGADNAKSWEASLLAEILGTLGAAGGVAGTMAVAADLWADTYAVTSGAAADISIVNNTDLRGANFRVDIQGYQRLMLELDDGGSTATVNGMYRFLW